MCGGDARAAGAQARNRSESAGSRLYWSTFTSLHKKLAFTCQIHLLSAISVVSCSQHAAITSRLRQCEGNLPAAPIPSPPPLTPAVKAIFLRLQPSQSQPRRSCRSPSARCPPCSPRHRHPLVGCHPDRSNPHSWRLWILRCICTGSQTSAGSRQPHSFEFSPPRSLARKGHGKGKQERRQGVCQH